MPHVDTPYKYEKLDWYPDMRDADRAIWERFIEKNPNMFDRVWYDVRVGDPADCPDDTPANCKAAWHDLTRWAIDVVAEDQDTIWVIEVKPFANAKAIGQALSYAALYDYFDEREKKVVPVVLTDTILKSAQKCADKLNVVMWKA